MASSARRELRCVVLGRPRAAGHKQCATHHHEAPILSHVCVPRARVTFSQTLPQAESSDLSGLPRSTSPPAPQPRAPEAVLVIDQRLVSVVQPRSCGSSSFCSSAILHCFLWLSSHLRTGAVPPSPPRCGCARDPPPAVAPGTPKCHESHSAPAPQQRTLPSTRGSRRRWCGCRVTGTPATTAGAEPPAPHQPLVVGAVARVEAPTHATGL